MPLAITTVSASASSSSVADRRRPPHAEPFAVRRERVDQPLGCPPPVRFRRGSRAGCPARAAARGRGRPWSRVTGWPCAASHSATVFRSAASARSTATTSDSRAVTTSSGRPSRKPVVPNSQRGEPDLQQTFLAGPALAVRGEHAAGHPRRAAFVGAVHAHRPAVERGAARHRQPDDAAADDRH